MMRINPRRFFSRAWRRVGGPSVDRPHWRREGNQSSADADAESALATLRADGRQRFRLLADLIRNRPEAFLFELALFKESLANRLKVEDAFNLVRVLLKFPETARVEKRPVRSLVEVARTEAAMFHDLAPGGVTFTVRPPKVFGCGDHRPIDCVTRSLYVACLEDASVRGRSSFISFRDAELLDFEGGELARAEERFASDPPVLQGSMESVWIRAPAPADLTLDRAFTLLGPMSPQFGHWMWEYIPKYAAALRAADIDTAPVLIDAHMPATHRQFLRMLLPSSTELIEVPYSASVRVGRLWCAPRLSFFPVFPRNFDLARAPDRAAPPERFAAAVREIWRRLDLNRERAAAGSERVFLARKPEQNHKLREQEEIEECARRRGFAIVYAQDLDFAEQVALMQTARHVVGPTGSAIWLSYLARPGAKLCILQSEKTYRATTWTGLMEELGVDVSIVTGPTVEEQFVPHHADYSIPARTVVEFLDGWLE